MLRVLATEAQDARDGVKPEKPGRLLDLFQTMVAGLNAEGLDLLADAFAIEVPEGESASQVFAHPYAYVEDTPLVYSADELAESD